MAATQGIGVNVWANTAQFVEGINKAGASLKGLEGIAKTAGAAIAAHISIGSIKALAEMGSKALQTEKAFANATKNMSIDASKWVTALRAATKGAVDESDLMQKAMKGITQGISQENITKLAELSMTVAIRKGMDVKVAYEGIIDAAETMRTRTLVSLGLISKAQAEVAEEAKKAGVEFDMLRIILENTANQQTLIGAMDETALSFQRAKAAAQNFWESIGKEIAVALGGLYDMANIIKNLFSAEGRAANIKRAGEVLSTKAMNEVYFPSEGTPNLKSPYLDSLKGAAGRKKASDEAAKHAEAIKKVIDNLKFEYDQLQRTDEEQKIYNSLKQASVTIESQAGQEISKNVSRLYAMEKALKAIDEYRAVREKDELQANADSLEDFLRASDEKRRARQTDEELMELEARSYLEQITNAEHLRSVYQRMWEDQHEALNIIRDAWGLTNQEIYDGTVNTWTEVGDVIASASEQMSATLSNVMIGFVKGTTDARAAVESLATSILDNVIQALIKIGMQQILLATIGKTIQSASTATTVASMASVAAAAAPAASLLSMATFGASATAGTSAFMTGLSAMIGASMAAITAGQGMAQGTTGMAEGGVINEHIIGRGTSGRLYEFGEEGPERVTPMRRGKSASTINITINGNVLNNHDELARVLVPAIRKAERDGV